MENKKINIAELLKDCPRGMELNCLMYEDVYFDYVDECNIIHCYIQRETYKTSLTFNQHGTPNSDRASKCVIFPKGKTTWEEFELPYKFKDGDIVTWKDGGGSLVACIYKERLDISFSHHIALYKGGLGIIVNGEIVSTNDELCIAAEEEKAKLFKAIKDNGYKWNEETKTLEKLVIKPKFKVGNKIRFKKNHNYTYTITDIREKENEYECGKTFVLRFSEQDNWELVPDKFDINNLKPLQPVLVRDTNGQVWTMDLFSHKIDTNKRLRISFVCVGHYPNQCIPYEGNEHLLGTTDDCDEYYKMWE